MISFGTRKYCCVFAALTLTVLSGCSTPERPPKAEAQAKAPAVPDLAKTETWDRSDWPFHAKGRVKLVVVYDPLSSDLERECFGLGNSPCILRMSLAVQGPRERDLVWLVRTPTEDDPSSSFRCSTSTGWCPLPVGEAEIEGRMDASRFTLSKEPTYPDGRAPGRAPGVFRDEFGRIEWFFQAARKNIRLAPAAVAEPVAL